MLREVRLRNFAVVESVSVGFAPGLNVLTGETGAGKSILIDAIVLVRGGRAQSDVIRAEAETATVEAISDMSVMMELTCPMARDASAAADQTRSHRRSSKRRADRDPRR